MRHRKALALVLIAAGLLSACTFKMNDGSVTIPDTERPAPSSPVGSGGGSEPFLDREPPVESEESPEDRSVYYEGLKSRDGASSGRESSPVMATPQPIQDVEIREIQELKAGQCNDNLRFDEFQAFSRAPTLAVLGACTLAAHGSGSLPAALGGLVYGTTYYVRPDGGSAAACTGMVDAPYPGTGTARACAWDHPFRALEPSGEAGRQGMVRISGGDTLVIGPGSYAMGYGAPGADNCDSDYPYDCTMPPVPSGPDDAHPTRIVGAGWDRGCPEPPELWGTERPWQVLSLDGSSNVEVACLEITDHAGCAEFHSGGLACNRSNYPHGDWAPTGLFAQDSANVVLRDLNIHGLAAHGVLAARLADWTVEDVRVVGNGWVGWDGDIEGNGGDDANTGSMVFRRWTVAWNGCVETYPGAEPTGCWAQSAGGYGDGVGTGTTGGDWVIEDSAFLHNTSDGLDLLYHTLGGTITLRRTIARGNAGNQIKTAGPAFLENVLAVGNCAYFEGQSFTHNVDPCRALGNTLALLLTAGDAITVVNSTVAGEGDCLVTAECLGESACDGSESILLRNTVFEGGPQYGPAVDTTCLTWTSLSGDPFAIDHAVIHGVKGMPSPCPQGSHCGVPPGIWNTDIDVFDARLRQDSPAVDGGATELAPAVDLIGHIRAGAPDIGAYEWRTYVHLPLILRPAAP